MTLLRLLALSLATLLLLAACSGEESDRTQKGSGNEPSPSPTAEETTVANERTEDELTPAEAKIGPNEITNMTPADGKPPDKPQKPPENPPEGVKTYPATTNESVEGPINYDRQPPTNGKQDPLWQNCGFYSEPVKDRNAVHSMDHGVVWISYRPDLSQGQIDQLRPYGKEEYVIVAPYPGLKAPVVATAWRNQLYLKGADDPRLRQFVDGFRNTTTAPLSGNRCIDGVGDPEVSPS